MLCTWCQHPLGKHIHQSRYQNDLDQPHHDAIITLPRRELRVKQLEHKWWSFSAVSHWSVLRDDGVSPWILDETLLRGHFKDSLTIHLISFSKHTAGRKMTKISSTKNGFWIAEMQRSGIFHVKSLSRPVNVFPCANACFDPSTSNANT